MRRPLILLPGLSASRQVFEPQLRQFPEAIVPDWPRPGYGETFTAYAERFAKQLRTHRPCILGGMSFGGMLAQEMARFLEPECLLLMATVRGPNELPLYGQIGKRFRGLIPFLPLRLLQALTWGFECPGIRSLFPLRRVLARQFREADRELFRWSLDQICQWRESPVVNCPVWHIHGDNDRVLPASRTTPDCLVAGAGHVPSLSHPQDINRFIRECLQYRGGETLHSGNLMSRHFRPTGCAVRPAAGE